MSRILLLAFVAAFGMVSPVYSQDSTPLTPFEKADFDGDGKISFEEYRNRASYLFYDYDSNQDNFLTPDELPEYRNEKGVVVTTGTLTISDYMASISHSFDMGDLNKDGYLQPNEWGVAPSLNK